MVEKTVNVKVVLEPSGSNPPFHFESDDLPIGKNNVIVFNNIGKFKGFLIRFTLDNSANPGFLFPTHTHGNDHLDQALWATATGPCPTTAVYWDSVFKAKSVEDGGRTLVVWNKNAKAQEFSYTLRVVNGEKWLDLDPVGSNQNGGISEFRSLAATAVTGGIVALATVATLTSGFEPARTLGYGIGGAIVGLIVGFLFDRV